MIPEEYIRKIIHVDMDAFYASVEQRDNPDLRGKPVAVGGSRERGVVAAASYEARKYGVRSAMPSSLAYRKCPDIIFVRSDFEKYRSVSRQIRSIFFEYTDLVEPLSLDEAYLDVTENKKGIETATRIAREIRQRIYEETHLTASAGISINKFLAKVASDINKPNGQKTIMPDRVIAFLEDLPIQKFYGIGAKTAEKMKRLGIHHGKDLKKWDLPLLIREFGKSGQHYFNIVRGLQKSRVKPDRIRKSLGAERTFSRDLKSADDMKEALEDIMSKLQQRIEATHTAGKTVTLKLKYFDFEQHTRSFTFT
ncbi:MAG: DNA polymerase IV, partial [Owenweeksia sp.]